MTRPATNALVLDGQEIKLRLLAERMQTRTPVHVDWLRFTVLLRNAETPSAALLFGPEPFNVWEAAAHRVHKLLAELPDADHWAGAQAMELAQRVAGALGQSFTVAAELRKGHDFYRHRWSIERNGQECGWVGFLASSDSPRQRAQAGTMHVNLYGGACTFADAGWMDRMAAIIEEQAGTITRADLALDFFDGMPGGLDQVLADYKAGLLDVAGKRPKCNMVGDWANGAARSFYVGSKEAGKQTNVYEKGHQLFGADSGSAWHRIELRYGNKLRVLPVDLLRRPADFFAGASDWHSRMLALADAQALPEPIKTAGRLALETVEAEVYRNVRWVRDTAAASVAFLLNTFDVDQIADLVATTKRPGRLRKFSMSELVRAASGAVDRFIQPAAAGPGMHQAQPLAA